MLIPRQPVAPTAGLGRAWRQPPLLAVTPTGHPRLAVEVDAEVIAEIKAQADAFVDRPNDVLRRVFGLPVGDRPTCAPAPSPREGEWRPLLLPFRRRPGGHRPASASCFTRANMTCRSSEHSPHGTARRRDRKW